MPRIILTLILCSQVFAFSSLQAQEVDSKIVLKSLEQAAEVDKAVDAAKQSVEESSVLESPKEDVVERVAKAEQTEEADDQGEEAVGEVVEGPAIVSVNAQGELVGQANATVSGDLVPIEANITLVSGGVLIGKVVANENGSFSFPNVIPGDYQVFGCAASYCGQRSCTVVSNGNCCDVVNVRLDQVSECGCDGGFASAPAASFGGGAYSSFGGGGGGGFGGGGGSAAGGGGGLIGGKAFRLLTIGGVATAIAVGASDSDDVSPSE